MNLSTSKTPAYGDAEAPTGVEPVECSGALSVVSQGKGTRRKGWIYLVQRDDGLVKIGFSEGPRQRVRLLEREHGELYVLACVEGTTADESWLHRRWAHLRVEGEWFKPANIIFDLADAGTLLKRRTGLCRFGRNQSTAREESCCGI